MRAIWGDLRAYAERAVREISQRLSPRVIFLLWAVPLAVVTTGVVARFPLVPLPEYRVGDILKADLVAPVEVIVVDPERTARLREEEARKIPPIFRYAPDQAEAALEALREAFARGRERFVARMEEVFGRREIGPDELRRMRARLEREVVAPLRAQGMPFPVTDEVIAAWAIGEEGEAVRLRLEMALRALMSRYIRPDGPVPLLEENITGEVRLVPARLEASEDVEQILEHPRVRANEIITLGQARDAVRQSLSPADGERYGAWLAQLLRPTCFPAEDLSERVRRQATAHLVATTRYAPRQLIAARGQRVTPEIRAAVDALRKQIAETYPGRRALGLVVLSFVLYYALWRMSERTRVYYLTSLKIFLLAALSVFVSLLLVRVGLAISSGVAYRLGTFDSPEGYQFAIPYAAGALVVSLLLESRLALVVGLTVSLLAGVLARDFAPMLYAVVGNIVAIYGVGRYQRRDTITRAGLLIGGANVGAMGIVLLSQGSDVMLGPLLWNAFCGLVGGALTAALAAFALPITESLFGIVTDVKLLELSNVELPLLKRLAIEAPGTYHHSLIVATLAEEAAKAIGAHALLVRVGSYYHDVGKLVDPGFYIENQRGRENPHERLSPEESARRIMQHVSEGIRLAQEHGLPRQIVDLIPQHHGTRRLHYFYAKARERAAQTGESVDEQRFRYPGPKPQTIEAAIVMMCDSSEAAVRSLRRPTPEMIRLLVRRILEDMVTDGQFDECNLRMRDLTRIREMIIQTLGTIYHERVPYPGFREEELVRDEVAYEAAPGWDIGRAEETPSRVEGSSGAQPESSREDISARLRPLGESVREIAWEAPHAGDPSIGRGTSEEIPHASSSRDPA